MTILTHNTGLRYIKLWRYNFFMQNKKPTVLQYFHVEMLDFNPQSSQIEQSSQTSVTELKNENIRYQTELSIRNTDLGIYETTARGGSGVSLHSLVQWRNDWISKGWRRHTPGRGGGECGAIYTIHRNRSWKLHRNRRKSESGCKGAPFKILQGSHRIRQSDTVSESESGNVIKRHNVNTVNIVVDITQECIPSRNAYRIAAVAVTVCVSITSPPEHDTVLPFDADTPSPGAFAL